MKDKLALAQDFAKKFHQDHLRLSGESYYSHILKTVKLLKDVGITDETTLILGYLHHSKRLSDKEFNELKELFGEEIVVLIKKYNELRSSEIRQITANEINKKLAVPTFLNLTQAMRLILIRLADKTTSIQTAYSLDEESRKKAAERALYLYDPVTQLLGLYEFSHILQNEAFKLLNPGEYLRIKKYISKALPRVSIILKDVESFLYELLKENGIDSKIEWRLKNIYSIYKKSIKKNYDIENLLDVAALRILVNDVEQCYKTEDMLGQLWMNIQNQRDDYIQKPKPSGYKSIHNVFLIDNKIPLEIQIKTFQMHEENEFGAASHLLYKMGDLFLKKVNEDPELLKSLHYQQPEQAHLETFSKMVYVFTPKGDIVELPKGSNLIDFAYSIHADLGNHCVGGMVNSHIQKLEYELKDGDRVEIKTSTSKKKPSEDWLKMVKTRRAKFFIRRALR